MKEYKELITKGLPKLEKHMDIVNILDQMKKINCHCHLIHDKFTIYFSDESDNSD
jgi:hypothetical protein